MDFDGIPDAKRPKHDDDNTLPGPPGGRLRRQSSIASAGGNKESESFPQQLMKMLNDPANAHIVAWTSGGDSFVVTVRFAGLGYFFLCVLFAHDGKYLPTELLALITP